MAKKYGKSGAKKRRQECGTRFRVRGRVALFLRQVFRPSGARSGLGVRAITTRPAPTAPVDQIAPLIRSTTSRCHLPEHVSGVESGAARHDVEWRPGGTGTAQSPPCRGRTALFSIADG